jgi:single-strand DNA-binding protein
MVNSVILEGNLVRDAEVKYSNSGTAILSLSVAYNDSYTKDGKKIEQCHFFDVTAFKDVALACANLNKGTLVHVEGKLVQDRWEKDGKKQSRVKIMAFDVVSKSNGGRSSSGNPPTGPQGSPTPRSSPPQAPRPQPAYAEASQGEDSEIPF